MKMGVDMKKECSITSWYSKFAKDSLESSILDMPNDVINYIEDDAFVLPAEATKKPENDLEWADGSTVDDSDSEDEESRPTFPEFSKKIQEIIDFYEAVFVKTNWRTPGDATWVAPTKTLKCTTLEEIYLLLKSSDRISDDLATVKKLSKNDDEKNLKSCLVLKEWRDINPGNEFRCFVINKELMGISQRDLAQYHKYIETEKYNIQTDISSLFNEKIKNQFELDNYTFDVIRYKKDKVKIVDFGLLDETTTKGTLFTFDELNKSIVDPPEFRFIGEEMGIQPNTSNHFCAPQEIREYFAGSGNDSVIDFLRSEVENQRLNDD